MFDNKFIDEQLQYQIDNAVTEDFRDMVSKVKEKGSDKLKHDYIMGRIGIARAYRKANVHVTNNSGKYEWHTPQKFIDAARKTMGTIDLDPASSEIANRRIGAERFFTEEENGLEQKWFGNVWMNPPYANSLVSAFTKKLLEELPNINSACVLVNNATETRWFQEILDMSAATCLLKGRIKFIDINGNQTGSSLQGQIILYFGTNVAAFYRNFHEFGTIMMTIKE